MVLTKQDLQDWNSHPVTKAIFAGIKNGLAEIREESCLCSTVDETAMKAAKNVGIAEGINSIIDAYELLEEGTE